MYSTGIHNKATVPTLSSEEIETSPKPALNPPKSTQKATKTGQIVPFPRWEPAPDLSGRANHLGRFLTYPGRTIPDANGGPWAGYCLRSTGWMVAELQATQWGAMSWSMRTVERTLAELNRAGYIARVSRDKRRRPRPGRAPDRHRKGQAIRINLKKIWSPVAEVDRENGGSGPPQNSNLAEVDHPLITLKSNNQERTGRESLSGNSGARKLQGSRREPPLPPSKPSDSREIQDGGKRASKGGNDNPRSDIGAKPEPHRQRSDAGPEKIPTPDDIEAKLTTLAKELGIEPHRGSRARMRRRWEIRDATRDGFTAEELEQAVRAAADDGYAERAGLDLVKHAVANCERYLRRGGGGHGRIEQGESESDRRRAEMLEQMYAEEERERELQKKCDHNWEPHTRPCKCRGFQQGHELRARDLCADDWHGFKCTDCGVEEREARRELGTPPALIRGEGFRGDRRPIMPDSVKRPPGEGVSTGRDHHHRQPHQTPPDPPTSSGNVVDVDEITVARDLGKERGATNVATKTAESSSEALLSVEDSTNVAPYCKVGWSE